MKRCARVIVTVVVCAAMVLALWGCAAKTAPDQGRQPSLPPATQPTVTPGTDTSAEPTPSTPTEEPRVMTIPGAAYFLHGEQVAPAYRLVASPGTARSALEALLAGPTAAEKSAGLTSAIPSGTKLRSIKVANGTATVDLTDRFGSGGGSLSMNARVAQVVFTLTRFPTVERVAFRIDGRPAEALGGEGLMLTEPQERSDFEALTGDVLIDTPTWGSSTRAGSGLKVRGTANVFEAVFNLEVVDAKGSVVARKRVQATSGTGTRGTYSATLSIPSNAAPGTARVIAWFASAKDGSRVTAGESHVTIVAP